MRWPSEPFWEDRKAWALLALGAVAAFTLIEHILAGVRAWFEDRRERQASLVQQILYLCLIQVDEATDDSLEYYNIGLHVWRKGWRLTWRPPFGRRQLIKVAKVRLSDTMQSSRVVWTKGKGVIGKCWETKAVVRRDLGSFKPYVSGSQEAWYAAPPDFRLNLTWEEFQRTANYGGVIAAPMLDKRDRFRGCVSVDGPEGTYQTLDTERVRDAVNDAANTCAGRLYDR